MNAATKTRARPAAIIADPGRRGSASPTSWRARPPTRSGSSCRTPRRGCSGLAYSVDYVTSEIAVRREDRHAGRHLLRRRRLDPLPDRQHDGLGRGRFRRRLHLRQPQRQGRVRLRRELHRLTFAAGDHDMKRVARRPSCASHLRWPLALFARPPRAGRRRARPACIRRSRDAPTIPTAHLAPARARTRELHKLTDLPPAEALSPPSIGAMPTAA